MRCDPVPFPLERVPQSARMLIRARQALRLGSEDAFGACGIHGPELHWRLQTDRHLMRRSHCQTRSNVITFKFINFRCTVRLREFSFDASHKGKPK